MEKLFGIQTDSLAYGSGILASLMFLILIFVAIRAIVMFKIGARNLPRNPNQTVLIILGLMLSTTIIGASLGVGDTVTHSIRKVVFDGLGHTDETIRPTGSRFFGEEFISRDQLDRIKQVIKSKTNNIDGVMSLVEIVLPAENLSNDRAEARMTLRGFNHSETTAFGKLFLLDGTEVNISSLGKNELFLTGSSSSTLSASSGDQLRFYSTEGVHDFVVKGILKVGGLASGGSIKLAILNQSDMQNEFALIDKFNEVLLSNKGGIEGGLKYSEEITKNLRLAFSNAEVSNQMFDLLNSDKILDLIEKKIEINSENRSVSETDRETFGDFLTEIRKGSISDEFINLINDSRKRFLLFSLVKELEDSSLLDQLVFLSLDLGEFQVEESKKSAIEFAELIGSSTTTFLGLFGSFSIIVGILLIFLVMVLLSASRQTEMGMARAIGFKRYHLIQIFTLEGWLYAILSSLVGTLFGVAVSFTLVYLLQNAIGSDDFNISPKYTLTSLVITFSSGMILTLITVIISSYRISKLNIIVAIRGLTEEMVKPPEIIWKDRFKTLLIAIFWPVKVFKDLRKSSISFFKKTFRVIFSILPPIWLWQILKSIFSILSPLLRQGWPIIILGIIATYYGLDLLKGTYFSVGISLVILGIGTLLRYVFSKKIFIVKRINRFAASLEGALLLAFWGAPFDTFEGLTGELEFGVEVFILSGVAMVASSVWLIMNNTQIILWVFNFITGKAFSSLQAVFKTAVAYPINAKFRTGLTVSMFALIIFTLVINTVLSGLDNVGLNQPDRLTGGYDIQARLPKGFDIGDLKKNIEDKGFSDRISIDVVAKSVDVPSLAKDASSEESQFDELGLKIVNDSYFSSNKFEFSHYDPKYGSTPMELWLALKNDSNLAVLSNDVFESGDPFGPPQEGFLIKDFPSDSEADKWVERQILFKPNTTAVEDKVVTRTVIGILDPLAGNYQGGPGRGPYMITSDDVMVDYLGQQIPFDTIYISLKDGDAKEVVPILEKIFIVFGMDAVDTIGQIESEAETGESFNRLFQGFVGLGLLVGVAAIGVLSVRAVVERRKIIGTLRAIGYTSNMIQVQFLLEAIFVTVLGVLIGVGLGILTSWNIFNSISQEVEGLTYVVPWVNIIVLVSITVVFALITAFLPARQAAKIFPAEVLRNE